MTTHKDFILYVIIMFTFKNGSIDEINSCQMNDDFKSQVVNYIYSSINISNFKFELLRHSSDLNLLLNKKFFVSANFQGRSFFLVFMKIKDKFYACLIDRKTLCFNKSKLDISKVNIKEINMRIDASLYLGTILDGIYIQNKGENMFVITDVHKFMDKDLSSVPIDDKLTSIKEYLKVNMKPNKYLSICVNILYNIEDIKHLINNVIPSIKFVPIKGICFYPEMSGTKLIYIFNQESKQDNQTTTKPYIKEDNQTTTKPYIKEDNQVTTKPYIKEDKKENVINNTNTELSNKQLTQKYKYIPKTDGNIFASLEMKQTSLSDVYKMFSVKKINKNDKVILKRINMGIAYIPSMKKSMWCTEITSKTNGSALVNCTYNRANSKWEPISLEKDKKIPSLIEEIEEDMDIIIESDED